MMDYSPLIEFLRQKQYLTNLEKDILDTVNELQKTPFDRISAELQARKNNAEYPAMYGAIMAQPNTISIPWERTTERDIQSTLDQQLNFLIAKELEELNRGK